ncbi:MAG: type IV secretion system DNA-binding domain-containing protein [Hyphomicrobiaceae bacterium]
MTRLIILLISIVSLAAPATARDPNAIFNFLQGKLQEEIERQNNRQRQRDGAQQLYNWFNEQWQACFNGTAVEACDAALSYPQLNWTDRQRLLARRQAIVTAQEVERRAAEEEAERLRAEQAAEREREREAREQRWVALQALTDDMAGCRSYLIARCDAARASELISEEQRNRVDAFREVAVAFAADSAACSTGNRDACATALSSPVANDGDRVRLHVWLAAATPPPTTMDIVTSALASPTAAISRGLASLDTIPRSTLVAAGLAAMLALALLFILIRGRRVPVAATTAPDATTGVAQRTAAAPSVTASPEPEPIKSPVPQPAAAAAAPCSPPRSAPAVTRDTPAAIASLELAHAYLDEVHGSDVPDAEDEIGRRQRLNTLALAVRKLEAAERADPDAVLEGADADGTPYRLTMAELKAEALLLEGLTHQAYDTRRAVPPLTRAAALNPSDPRAFFALGLIQAANKNRAAAVEALKAAVALEPGNITYRVELDRAENMSDAEILGYKATRGRARLRRRYRHRQCRHPRLQLRRHLLEHLRGCLQRRDVAAPHDGADLAGHRAMIVPPTWALLVAHAARSLHLRPWYPERAIRDHAEPLSERIARLHAAWTASRHADNDRAGRFIAGLLDSVYREACDGRRPAEPVQRALSDLAVDLTLQNDDMLDLPIVPNDRALTALEARALTDRLIEVQTRLEHDVRIHGRFAQDLAGLMLRLVDDLPPSAFDDRPAPFTVPLYALSDAATLTSRLLVAVLYELAPQTPDPIAALAFAGTRAQLWRNLLDASRLTPEQADATPHKIVGPKDCDLSPPELIDAYLGGTPLARFATTPLPFALPLEARFEHMHVVGGAGHGKTQTLQHLIATDLAAPDPPSLIIIDSHGDMLASLERLALFAPDRGALAKRLIIIDPEDVEHPPALNMFDMGGDRLARYTPAQREQVEAATIELYDYIFRALSADLTSKQGVAFAFVARLLLTIPGATIHTLRELMEDQSPSIDRSPFHDAIQALDPTARAFFEGHFFTKAVLDTKRQIARRIYDFIRNKTFERMFSSPVNKLDMFAAMNSGAIVLVNTSKAMLKSAASALFGRTMIALTLRAAFERVAIPPDERRPAFLIIDEAADYFDANVDALLTQVRKYKLGLVFAHQYLDQLDGALRASFAANTAIKLAGGVSDKDARALAPDMRCRADFIAGQVKRADHTSFATYVRNVTPTALSLTVPFGTLDRMAQMSEAEHRVLRERNRARYCVRPAEVVGAGATVSSEVKTEVSEDDPDWTSGTTGSWRP